MGLVKQRVDPNYKQTILYHSHNLRWQGAQNSLFEIAKGIKDRTKYGVILTASSSGELSSAYEEENIQFFPHPFPSRGVGDPPEMEKYLSRLANFYKKSGASLIHANTLQNYFSVLAAQKAGLPVLINIRESENPEKYYDYLPSYLRDRAFNCVASADSVVFVANATMQLWKKHLSDANFHLVRNGVDTNRLRLKAHGCDKTYTRKQLGLSDHRLSILNVGTFCDRKNQMELLQAYDLILDLGISDIEIIFIGANNTKYSRHVTNFADQIINKGGHIRVLQETNGERGQSTLAKYYLASDIFNLCSLNESYPRVTMEAFAFGLPVISSECFGTVEQISHNQNGLLYKSGDIQGLKDAILKLYKDRKLLEEMRRNIGSHPKQSNSYALMLQKYEQIYAQTIQQRVNACAA